MENEYLKRGEGKTNGNIKKDDFWLFYKQCSIDKRLDRKTYNSFLNDYLKELSTKIVTEALEVKITNLGLIRVRSKKLTLVKRDGTVAKTLKPDWKATWKYWEEKYPNISRDEIIKIDGKKLVYHENDHTQGEFYEHFWDKRNSRIEGQSLYVFEPSRNFSRLITLIVKDLNRKTFYYE